MFVSYELKKKSIKTRFDTQILYKSMVHHLNLSKNF